MIVATRPAASVCLRRLGRIFTCVSSRVVRVVILTAYRTMARDERCASGSDSERLTAVLRRAGVLTRGEVVDVAVETSRDTLISRIARLRLTYAQGDDAGPSHVFFKTSREDAAEALRELGRKEVTFYDVVAVATP